MEPKQLINHRGGHNDEVMASRMMLLDDFLPTTALGLETLVESLMNPTVDAYKSALPLAEDAVLSMATNSSNVLSSSSKYISFLFWIPLTVSIGATGHDYNLPRLSVISSGSQEPS